LLNDKYKFESLQGDGSRTRQEIPQTAGCKARAGKRNANHVIVWISAVFFMSVLYSKVTW